MAKIRLDMMFTTFWSNKNFDFKLFHEIFLSLYFSLCFDSFPFHEFLLITEQKLFQFVFTVLTNNFSAWNYTVFCRIAVSAVAMTSFWCDFGKKLYDSRHRCFAWNCTVFCRIFAEFLRALVDRWGYSAKNCTIPDETLQPGFVQFFAEIGIFPPFWVVLITKPQ